MVNIHDTIDQFFMHLENTGSISDSNLVKITLLSLIDDYYSEIIACNPKWKDIIDEIIMSFRGTSCLFKSM